MILLFFLYTNFYVYRRYTQQSAGTINLFVLSGWRYALLGVCLLLQACASPTGNLAELASQIGFHKSKVRAQGFDLLAFDNIRKIKADALDNSSRDQVLRIYLEGDGTPWLHRTIITADPTPLNPLMLRLMRYERSPAVYLGRPCYNGFSSEPECDSSLWTFGRFSEPVVGSMASAIRALLKRHKSEQLWLIGHSGGGALAMLLAERLPEVRRVVTVAGNLNTDAWTRHHGYTPLFGSINPARTKALSRDIWQWHLIGGRDEVIPKHLVTSVIMAQPSASAFEFSRFNHGCCWERVWPDVLSALAQSNPRLIPGKQFKVRSERQESWDSQ